jgi:hypothetical protein
MPSLRENVCRRCEQRAGRGDRACYKPRIACENDYTRWLFGNVESCVFGCARGIAIVEDKYLPELNPNVAIEWGWMTGMGRDGPLFTEQGFDHGRADWSGGSITRSIGVIRNLGLNRR